MQIIESIIQIVTGIACTLTAIMSILLFLRFRWPAAAMWGLKVVLSALSSLFVLVGMITLSVGFATNSLFLIIVGVYAALIYFIHFISVTRPPGSANNFETAFGPEWKNQIRREQKRYFLSHRTALNLNTVPEPRFEQNISFATIPGTDRKLLCDVWQPNQNIKHSGLAFIFMHGSAFYFLDKDCGTRPFFKHLAAQGHVIMDIAYRLAPETNVMGMIHDVKRAIVWMRENAIKYGVNPQQISVGGGSAGGYLALMAAYTANDALFTPIELEGKDIGTCAAIAVYPAVDLKASYYYTNQHLTTRSGLGSPKKKVPTKMPGWIKKSMGEDFHRFGMDKDFENIGAIAPILGGDPDECAERYRFFSAITHVSTNCPPTLLIHGVHDIMAPVKSTRVLHARLKDENVPSVIHILPQTDHAFDAFLPAIAPSAHNAFYDIERFLAFIAAKSQADPEIKSIVVSAAEESDNYISETSLALEKFK